MLTFLVVAYDDSVIQIKYHTDILYLTVVVQIFPGTTVNNTYTVWMVDYVSAHNYIENNRPSHLHIFT